MKLKLAFLLLLCPIFNASAQALQPGEKLPQQYIDGINPADHKDKLLILDFWATSCASCLESMPKLAALQNQYGSRLKIMLVAYEKPERIVHFLNARPDLSSLELPILARDTLLSKMFPHQYLPHVVWIYKGTYIIATGAEYVNSNSIDSLLSGKSLVAAQKADIIGFDYKQALFPVMENSRSGVSPLYTSILAGYISGLPLAAGTFTDSTLHRKRCYFINHSIAHLYAIALNSSLPLQANRRILPNDQDFDYRAADGYRRAWEQQHCYCYEFIGPAETPYALIKNKLRSDLDQCLRLNGRIENRQTACLFLEGKPKPSTADRVIRQDTSGHYTRLLHINATDLIYILNQQNGMPPVLDQTRSGISFDLNVNQAPVTLADWQQLLLSNGMRLIPAQKTLPMFILTTN